MPQTTPEPATAQPAFRILWWIAGLLCIVGLLGGAAFIAVCWPFITADHSPFDWGPFPARAAVAPASPPTSSVRMGAFTVDCYTQRGKPVVLTSRRSDGSLVGAWQMQHRQPGMEKECQCDSCAIEGSVRKRNGYVIHGWTGYEHATFYFDQRGRLTEYYVSW
jgi:hypothetical protein